MSWKMSRKTKWEPKSQQSEKIANPLGRNIQLTY